MSKEVPPDRAIKIQRFGRPMVLWRADGQVRASWDGCPHRGASFDGAPVKNGQLTCPFHSFAFDKAGACTAIPCDGPEAPRRGLQLRSLKSREEVGLVWVWVAPGEATEDLPHFPAMQDTAHCDFSALFVAPWDLVVETMLDYAHLPTVHARSIGASMDMAVRVETRPTAQGLVLWTATKSTEGGGDIEWKAPASWQLRLSPKVVNVAFFVPVDPENTYVIFRFVQSYVTTPLVSDLMGWLANLFNRRVVGEDRAVIEGMARTLRCFPQQDRLVAADAPIAAFRRARKGWLSPAKAKVEEDGTPALESTSP
jgi:phenylpropionate dioxygenase-like ring-hydroxylating dioxygenase large terminal subunit